MHAARRACATLQEDSAAVTTQAISLQPLVRPQETKAVLAPELLREKSTATKAKYGALTILRRGSSARGVLGRTHLATTISYVARTRRGRGLAFRNPLNA